MRRFFAAEWAKLRVMSFRDKRQYLWEYYRLHLFGIVLAALLTGSLLNALVFNPPRADYLYVAIIGFPTLPQQQEAISDALLAIVEDPQTQTVGVFNYTFAENPQVNMAIQTRFMALLQQQAIDIFLTTATGAYELATESLAVDVSEVLQLLHVRNPALAAWVSPRLAPTAFTTEAGPQTAIIKIPLADSAVLAAAGVDSTDVYLSVVANTLRPAQIAAALEVLLEQTD